VLCENHSQILTPFGIVFFCALFVEAIDPLKITFSEANHHVKTRRFTAPLNEGQGI
jgi:hypothetical protein